MNELQIFNNPEFGEIRTVEIEGEPWLVGKDVAVALGYQNPSKALANHVDAEDKLNNETLLSLGQRGGWLINESGLYSLVLSSKLPGAKKFRRWVTSEVLPSIRKHGAYMTPDTLDEMISSPEFGIKLLTALKEEQEKRKALEAQNVALEAENEAQKQTIADFQPIQQYVDTILSSKGTMTVTQIAADYDMTAYQLNSILHDAGIQHRVGKQWILYKEHMGKGYTRTKTSVLIRHDGNTETVTSTVWSQKGRLLIHEVLTGRGILAVMDRAA